MIFRLEYCNKASVTARVDIQKGTATPIYTVEGTAEPFVLFYNNDKGDKSGSFRSSGADINIYKTTEFNIDELKTSSETEISVKYYINNILNWSGFVIPDFFSETITGGQGVVSMVASDRLGTLKGTTLSGLSARVSNRSLAADCLAQTGLSLPLYTMADFTGDGTNIFNSAVLSQRMVDTKGRNVSCYDILSSILEETNSLIVQRNGAWCIVNKLQLEAGSGSLYSAPTTSSAWVENTVSFDEVSVGARRTITPVAAAVGVYHEHGGGRMHPNNYDFSQGVTGWTPVGGFVASTDNRQVLNYTIGGTGGAIYSPVYGEGTQSNHLVNTNAYVRNTNPIYLESAPIDIPYKGSGAIEVEIDVNGVGPAVYPNFAGAYLRVAVVAVSGTKVLTLAHGGKFVDMPSENPPIFEKEFDRSLVTTDIPAIAKGMKIKGTLEVADDLSTYDIKLRIYGGGGGRVILYNSVSVVMRNSLEIPNGSIFKTTQGANYTKDHEIPTVLWGDYLTSGLNGYFYDYPIDDTSSLYRPNGELHSKWTAYGDADTLPLLQHITRQKARMFSVAHDLLSADIATSTFDPLSIFVSCEGTSDETRYVVVSARFDFLRSNVSVELEEVAYATNSKRDYIYSYFGDGEDGISSIAGIAGGYTPSTGITIPPIPDIRLSELRAYLDIIDSDVATLTGTYNQINDSTVIDGAIKASLTTLFTAVTDAAGAYKTYALTALEDEVLTVEELAQLEILKQAYIDAVGAFKAVADPIITSLISVSLLKQNLQTYTSDKAQIDLVWSIISNNIYLVEPDKTTYDNAKSAYDTAYTAIVNKINEVIADGMATPAELAEVGTLTTAYLTALANYRSAEEVARKAIIDEQKRQTQEYAETQWQDVIDTQESLEQSLLNFSESINPITAQMMQLIVGDESLQYIFVESKVNPVRVSHSVSYDTVEKKLTVYAGWIKHLTLGITDISPEHTYKFWQLPLFTSAALTDPDKSYYLYAKCSDTVETGEFVLSETPIAIDDVSGYYHLLVGILNAETNLTRRFAPLYGFTEVLPGRITLDKIVSVDGKMVIDLINNTITSPTLKISSGGSDKDLGPYLDETAQDIQDAQAAANAAALAAQQAIEDAEANVGLINAEIANLQDQIDGKVSNWYYAYTPTLSNYPASDWTTNEIKDSHIGDTFTNTEPAPAENAGKSWRFIKDGSTYSWTVISDSDAIKALQEASKAQATADGKSTTYLFQPTKYKLGDTWVLNDDYTINGTAYKQGDLLTATQDSETFVQAHWIKRVRYTDDSAVDNLEIGGRNLLLNSDFSRGFDYYWDKLNSSPSSNFEVVGTALKATYVEGFNTDFGKRNFVSLHDFSSTDNIIISAMIKGEGDLKIRFGSTQNPVLHINNEIFKKFIQIIPKSNFGNGSLIFEVSSGELLFDRLKLERGTKPTDWTPAPEDVEADIETAKIEAENAAKAYALQKAEAERVIAEAYADDIVTAEEQARIDDVNAKLAAAKDYADAQDALLKTQQEAYADGKISASEQAAINAAKAYADLKKTEAQAYADGIVSDEEARAIADALAKYNASKAHAEQLVNDIEIGGRNLIVRHNEIENTHINPSGDIVSNSTTSTMSTYIPVTEGDVYTFSKNTDSSPDGGGFRWRWFDENENYIARTANLSNNFTWIVPSGAHFIQVSYPHSEEAKPKLEKGNKATDWTPAPEDVEASIETAKIEAENAAKAYALQKAEAERVLAEAYADGIVSDEEQARINDVNDKLAAAKAYADAQDALLKTQQEAYADGKISTAEQAAIDAAKDYADLKKTEAQAYADGIVSDEEARAIADALDKYNASKAHAEQLVKDIEIGGRNLAQLTNSKEWVSYLGGTISFGEYKGITTIKSTDNGSGYVGIQQGSKASKMLLREGEQYIISLLVRGTVPLTYNYIMHTGVANTSFGNFTYEQPLNEETFVKAYRKITATASYGLSTGSWFLTRPTVINEGDWVEITQLKIEKGNKPTDWTPAPEDVQAAIDEAVVKATYWSVKASAPVIYKDAINASTSGTHTPVTISGELRSGTTTTSGGFITVTPNGGTESTATASPRTIAPTNAEGKTSYTVRLYDTASKTTLLDTQTIPVVFKGASGANAINVVLGNEADVLPASPEGVVSDYAGSGTTIRVFEGATELSYGTGNGQYQVSASGSGITAGTPSTSGNTRVYGVASNMTADNATITFTISGKTADGVSFSFTKEQSFSKSRTGDKGADGEGGITISPSQQGYTYRADLNGDIIGSLANGMVELTIMNGSTPITCSSAVSGGVPTTNGTYRVTRTLGNGITTNQSLSGGKYRITPATLTVDEASVELKIRIMMGGVVTIYPLTLTYRKQFDGEPGAPGTPGTPGTPGAPGADGFTITASKDTHSYVTYPGGDIKGFLDAGLIKLSVLNGSTVLSCSSTSTSTPTVNGTYRVTNAVVSTGLTITKSISGSQFVLYPATFTSDEGTVTLTIVARMNNTNHTFTKVVTYNKVSDGADGSDADMTEYEYLKDAIGQDAELTGALFTLVTILLKESMAADVTAGISGEQGASLDAPAFWSGGTYAQAISNVAKIILRHDGSGQLAGGNIEWDDAGNVELSGKIASGGGISTIGDKIKLNSDGSGQLAGGNIEWDSSGNTVTEGLIKVPFEDGNYSYAPTPKKLRNYVFTNNNDYTTWILPDDPALNGVRVMFINWRTSSKTLRLDNKRFFGQWYSGDTKRFDIPANGFCEMVGFSIGTTFQGWLITNSGTIL